VDHIRLLFSSFESYIISLVLKIVGRFTIHNIPVSIVRLIMVFWNFPTLVPRTWLMGVLRHLGALHVYVSSCISFEIGSIDYLIIQGMRSSDKIDLN
jgi:hypothetical protein